MKMHILELGISFVTSLVCICGISSVRLTSHGKAHLNDGERNDSFQGSAVVET